MRQTERPRLAAAALVLLTSFALFWGCGPAAPPTADAPAETSTQAQTPLDVYVAAPDAAYRWEAVSDIEGDGFTATVIDLTSQQWLTEAEVDRPTWQHWLTVVQPAEVRSSHALLFIGGGRNGGEPPTEVNPILAQAAVATGTVTAELGMVPNQALTFVGDDYGPRVEDELIAYGWDKFLRSPMASGEAVEGVDAAIWLARLPMTKAAVRAMDTVTAFMASEAGGGATVDQFVVSGGSKRGWTTWTTAAVDERVVAIAPIVIDLLNVVPSFEHHYAAYGFWAPAVGDYEREGIMDWMGTPEYDHLLRITEPYSYIDRLDMPKMIINASGDQFFLPDSSQFYWDDLLGEKHVRYVANADHSLGGSDGPLTLVSFYAQVVSDTPRPGYTWWQEGGELRFEADASNSPTEVVVWEATNAEARDFRVDTIGRTWASRALEAEDGVYRVPLTDPEAGWTARFIEATFAGPEGSPPLKVTSEVVVSPTAMPYVAPSAAAERAVAAG